MTDEKCDDLLSDAVATIAETLGDIYLSAMATLGGVEGACSKCREDLSLFMQDLEITLTADMESFKQVFCEEEPANCSYYISEAEFLEEYGGFTDEELHAIKDHYFLNLDCMASRAFCYTKHFELFVCPKELMKYILDYYNKPKLIQRLEKQNFYNIDVYNDRDKRKTDTGCGEEPK